MMPHADSLALGHVGRRVYQASLSRPADCYGTEPRANLAELLSSYASNTLAGAARPAGAPQSKKVAVMSPVEGIVLNDLGRVIFTSLRQLAKQCREEVIDDIGGYWANRLADFLDGFQVSFPSGVNPAQYMLPFHGVHRFETGLYRVAGGGLGGGPTVDVLLQIWLKTESMNAAFGVPLIFRRVPSFGPIPIDIWDEIREIAQALNQITAACRILLIGHPDPFEMPPPAVLERTPIYALSSILAAGMSDPPRGMSGRFMEHFAYDIADGWIGDPVLGGDHSSPQLSAFVSAFDIAHVLRIQIRHTPGSPQSTEGGDERPPR